MRTQRCSESGNILECLTIVYVDGSICRSRTGHKIDGSRQRDRGEELRAIPSQLPLFRGINNFNKQAHERERADNVPDLLCLDWNAVGEKNKTK